MLKDKGFQFLPLISSKEIIQNFQDSKHPLVKACRVLVIFLIMKQAEKTGFLHKLKGSKCSRNVGAQFWQNCTDSAYLKIKL